jgi:thiamine transport system substrate-binding protein
MISQVHRSLAGLLITAVLTACAAPGNEPTISPTAGPTAAPTTAASPAATEVVLMTHDSFAISDAVLGAFREQYGAEVRQLTAGDAGSMVNQAILTREAPLADVLFGVDNTFLSRALDAGIFESYRPPAIDQVDPSLRLDDAQNRVTPIDYGDVCLNYDRSAFTADEPAPKLLEELTDARYRGQLVVENPATSSPGLAFMLATVARFGEVGDYTWVDYWAALRDNGVLAVSGWEEAYYEHFSGGAGEGDRPIVVSYATSPVAEVVFADPRPEEAPTGVVTDGCFRQIEFAGVLAGTRRAEIARRLVDFMLSPDFQADIPLNMFVFPVTDVELPADFVEHAARVPDPISMDPAQIDANREGWIEEWTNVVIR